MEVPVDGRATNSHRLQAIPTAMTAGGAEFFLPQNVPAHSEIPPVATEGETSQEVPKRQRRRTWRRLLHISATHWSMELRRTL